MRTALLRILFLLGPLAGAARAQSVRWDPPGGTLAVGEASTLQLVFEDCEPKGTPVPPRVRALALEYSGQSSSISITNGSYSHSVSRTYSALLSRKEGVEIPAFEVETNKGLLRVPAARFEPVGATLGGGQPLESAAHSRIETQPGSVWAGEVFGLAYAIQAARNYYPDFGRGAFDWNPDPLLAEDWSAPEPFESSAGLQPETGIVRRSRAIAHKPGSYRLNPAAQTVNLSVGVAGFGFFQQRQYQQFSVESSVPALDVRPLPPAPAGFGGAVGEFKLVSKVVPRNPSVGDPVTWTVELSGTGNWPDIPGLPSRGVSRDFQVIQPKARRTTAAGKLFDATLSEDVVLVPTREGSYSLDPVSLVVFNPKTGSYETLSAPGATVTVSPGSGAASAGRPGGQGEGGAHPGPGAGPGSFRPAEPAAPPAGLPRDPLPDAAAAPVPFGAPILSPLLAGAALTVILSWLWLASREARRTDPDQARRDARVRLAATIEGIRDGAAGPALRTLLFSWQNDAALLWKIAHAAPVGAAIADPAWSALWLEADRALYGPEASLPADWAARARSALAAKAVPDFALRRLFMPRNLLPFVFSAAIAILAGPFAAASSSARAAADVAAAPAAQARPAPESAYRRGEFAAAEKGWREAIGREPSSWSGRHNLSLALAQQDRWDEAAAQAAAAFVQRPESGAVRWQFSLACEKAGFVPSPLAEFLSPGPLQGLARIGSPAEWQRLLAAAAWIAAAAALALLAVGFKAAGTRRAWIAPAALAALALALVAATVSAVGWCAYGAAADARAGVVWRATTLRSVPTEADTAQKTVPLPAGSTARIDKSFLGWVRLSFDNGQTGWVRRDEVVWLWR